MIKKLKFLSIFFVINLVSCSNLSSNIYLIDENIKILSPTLIFFNFLTKVFLMNLSRFSFLLCLVQATIPPNDLSNEATDFLNLIKSFLHLFC